MSLAGRHVVVTRPQRQGVNLASALIDLGAVPVLFPALEIQNLADSRPIVDAAIHLDTYDLAVFVSPNAIEKALDLILPRRPWPPGLRVATLGKSSERELHQRGITNVLSPALRFDSEALLDLPELVAVEGKRVIVFCGEGGRDLLVDTLVARGATVDRVACYRRVRPQTEPTRLLTLWEAGQLDAVTLTSSEGLRNFFEMLGRLGQAWLRKTPTFVPHLRIAEQAQAFGLHRVVATDPGDAGLMNGLVQYFASDGNP